MQVQYKAARSFSAGLVFGFFIRNGWDAAARRAARAAPRPAGGGYRDQRERKKFYT